MTYASPTTINASAGITDFLRYINSVTEFWISRMLMIAIFILFLMGYLRSKADDDFLGAFAVGSYATSVVGLPMWLFGFVDGFSFSIAIGLTIISTALLILDKRGQ